MDSAMPKASPMTGAQKTERKKPAIVIAGKSTLIAAPFDVCILAQKLLEFFCHAARSLSPAEAARIIADNTVPEDLFRQAVSF